MRTQLLNSVGIELEVEDIIRETFPQLKFKTFNLNLHSDASCESNRYYILTQKKQVFPVFSANSLLGRYINRNRVGFEIVTNIVNTENRDEFKKDLKKLTEKLIELGESQESYRGSIHIHVNCPVNLDVLKKIIEIGGYLEKFFFSIGGMGYKFRGLENDSTYCRPITKYGPPVINTEKGLCQVYTTKNLLESETIDEFFNQYGDLPNQINNNYFPVRYTWLNLSPIYLDNRGSLEFRIFNKTLNHNLIYAAVEFCKLFVKVAVLEAFKPTLNFYENSVYNYLSKEEIIQTFRNVLEIAGSFPEEILELEKIINPITLDEKYYFSHLMHLKRGDITSPHWRRTENKKATVVSGKIYIPTFLDIHNIPQEKIFFDGKYKREENNEYNRFLDMVYELREEPREVYEEEYDEEDDH